MKRMLVVGALVFAVVEAALAADVAPPPPPVPPTSYFPATAPINWGGFYVGVNGGYGFGTSNWSSAAGSVGSFNTSGALFGGTLGLNLQANAFVFGVETDGDWTNLNGSSSNGYCSFITANATCETKSDWLALQLRFLLTSESMGHHDSEDHGWREHRSRRRLSFGHRRYGM